MKTCFCVKKYSYNKAKLNEIMSEFCCRICEETKFQIRMNILQPDRFEKAAGIQGDGYCRTWVECLHCGVYTNILPLESLNAITSLRSAYYEIDFTGSDISQKYAQVMSLPIAKSDNYGRVTRIINFVKRWFRESVSEQLRVMDVGAGTGVFLSQLIDRTKGSLYCLALEPDPIAASHLRKLNKFSVMEAMYQGQPELNGFNLITLNKVLEHIDEPLLFLKQISKSLATEESLLYIEVPDRITTHLRPSHDNILGSLHCHLYDPISLSYLVKRVGLELLYVNRILEPSGKLTTYAFAAPFRSLNSKTLPQENL